jgi:hypothetical protein
LLEITKHDSAKHRRKRFIVVEQGERTIYFLVS